MPVLNWIGKEAVVKHHKDVPFRLIEPVADLGTRTFLSASIDASPDGKAVGTDLAGGTGDAIFLLYNGILKDRSDIGGNVLNGRTLEHLDSLLPGFDGERIVYGARTRFDKKKLAALSITFHQLPYDLATKTWF